MSGDPPQINGDPGALAGIASVWGSARDNVIMLQGQLAQHGLDSWAGSSGGQFRGKLGDFHPHLGTVHQSLDTAAQRVGRFSQSLEGYQRSAGWYQQQLHSQRQSLSDAYTNQAHTSKKLATAQAKHAASSDPVTAAHHRSLIDDLGSALSDIGRGISDLEHDIAHVLSAFWDLFNNYVNDVEDCAHVVEGAAEGVAAILMGPAARALLQIAGEGLADLERGGESVAGRIGRDIEQGVHEAAHDTIKFIDDHWQGIREGLEITAIATAIVGGLALSLVPGVGFVEAGLIAGLASSLVSEVQAGGDEFVARSGNQNPYIRSKAANEVTADVVGAAVGLALSGMAVADNIGEGMSKVAGDGGRNALVTVLKHVDVVDHAIDGASDRLAHLAGLDLKGTLQAANDAMSHDGKAISTAADRAVTTGDKALDVAYNMAKTGLVTAGSNLVLDLPGAVHMPQVEVTDSPVPPFLGMPQMAPVSVQLPINLGPINHAAFEMPFSNPLFE